MNCIFIRRGYGHTTGAAPELELAANGSGMATTALDAATAGSGAAITIALDAATAGAATVAAADVAELDTDTTSWRTRL